MRLSLLHTFAADPGRVHSMLVDPDFLEHAARELGAKDPTAVVGEDSTSVSAAMPTPTSVSGFLGPRMNARQEYECQPAGADGSRTGTLFLTVEGAPMLLNGIVALRPTASGTDFVVDADLSITVPLIGRTLERSAVPDVQRMLEEQARQGDAWLARA